VSPSAPTVSVVIGARTGESGVATFLSALESQRDGVEAIPVCTPACPAELRERFSWATFVDCPASLVPELWSAGIRAAKGDIVALTIASMVPAPDWIQAIRREHEGHDAVGGAIEPGPDLRASDWAEYFCRYAQDMLPFQSHPCLDLPGDNAAYKLAVLEQVEDAYRDGFWEPVVHRRLAARGVQPWHSPEVVVHHGRSAGWAGFLRQRLAHGRAHGRQRGARFGMLRNVAGVAGSPLVPALLVYRAAREVIGRRRFRFRLVIALPYLLLFGLAWAVGEARGHLDALRAG
jgi:hypothetical protein